jgi:hypothetical protein
MKLNYFTIILVLIYLLFVSEARDITDMITAFDNPRYRFLFHRFRDWVFNRIGKTGLRTTGKFLQDKYPENMPFPCDTRNFRSKDIPKIVHKLRPGDFDVIAALGDSLTAATGAMATKYMELSMENRGVAWSIGGQGNWRSILTLPNILKEFNPKLFGYSLGDSFPFHKDTQFNMAEIGAVSSDMPFMAKALVKRLRNDPRVNFKKDWKLVTLTIGGNDICSFVCLMKNPEALPKQHRISLTKALRYLRDNLPRTFVNIVSVPSAETVVLLKSKPDRCKFIHRGECACWVGTISNVTRESRQRWQNIQNEFVRVEAEVAKSKEFRGLDEFAVVYQPWSTKLSLNVDNRGTDLSLLAYDCFHMSQKGNAWAATALWNNMLEPPFNKSLNWRNPHKRFLCPTNEHPYVYTYDNS